MSDCRHNAPNREPQAGDVQIQRQQLDEQTREELLDKLIDCLYSFEDESDMAALDRCLEELDAAGAKCEPFDVEQGLQDFHERFGDAFESSPQEVKKAPRFRRPLARIAIIAAALCAFVFTAQASGLDIIGAIARWTSEQFAFVKVNEEEREPNRNLGDATLKAALVDAGVVEELAPDDFPDGAEMIDIQVRQDTGELSFFAKYEISEGNFFVSIRSSADTPHSEVEINDPNVETYIVGGVEHHIMTDVTQQKATWYSEGWECRISGNLTREDLLLMIDSIYEGE